MNQKTAHFLSINRSLAAAAICLPATTLLLGICSLDCTTSSAEEEFLLEMPLCITYLSGVFCSLPARKLPAHPTNNRITKNLWKD